MDVYHFAAASNEVKETFQHWNTYKHIYVQT